MPPATAETKESITAEFLPTLEAIRSLPEANIPSPFWAVNVGEMPGDSRSIEAAQRNLTAVKAGDVALGATVECKTKPIRNIYEAALWAKGGDNDGEKMLENNIAKEASERMFKVAHVSDVRLDADFQGRLIQNGQLMDDVQRNAFQLASADQLISERTAAEANNNARIKRLKDEGCLEDHVFLVLSRCPDGVSDERLDDMNFFSKTKSLSIQATTIDGGVLHTESAFVAGVSNPDEERHDKKTVERIAEIFGLDYRGKSAAEIINMPLLIPKEFMKEGVVDIVKLYDEINGGLFFGQEADARPYGDIRRMSQAREAGFASDVEFVKRKLIAEAPSLGNAVAVSRLLGKLVKERMVKRAIKDDTLDPEVFGTESAGHINHVRTLTDLGDWELAAHHAKMAVSTAGGGSCPSALISLAENFGINTGIDLGESADQEAERRRLSWHGGVKKKGVCVKCDKQTIVGKRNYCRGCINC